MPYRLTRDERAQRGLCSNMIVPKGMRFPVDCNREAEPGSNLCRICAAAKRRGEQRSAVAINKFERASALRQARFDVVKAAVAWAESERGQPDTALYRAVVALNAVQNAS